MGEFMATCRRAIFSPEKAANSNSPVSLGRGGLRVLFGQGVDRDQKWPNAMLRRRVDCGREGGTPEHSNLAREYHLVYAPVFGCNEASLLEPSPRGTAHRIGR